MVNAMWAFSILAVMSVLPSSFSSQAVTLDNCHVKGIKEQVLCGAMSVPENPQKPQGKQISLNITVLPSFNAAQKKLPLLILAGGPGQSATEQTALINQVFAQVRQSRDIVLIDQRGTGKSNPLQCTNVEMEGLGLALDFAEQDMAAQAKECLALFKDSDLSTYSTNQAIDDFEAVRKALGYRQFHLYGGSYGTRAGLVYLRRYPQSVASAVLDSVAPTQVAIGAFGKSSERAFELLLADCHAIAQCKAAYPTLKADFLTLQATLNQVSTEQMIMHPVTGEQTPLLFERLKFLNTLRTALYSITLRTMVPLVVSEANKGNYRPFAGLYAALNSGLGSGMYMGLTLTILCSEDWPRMSSALLRQDNDNYVVGDMTTQTWRKMCSVWPKYPVAETFKTPVSSAVPTLLLSGRLDPVTPPAWGAMAAQTLSNSRHLVAVNGAHTVATHTCAARLIARFLDDGDLAALDDSCLTKARQLPFMINPGSTNL
ncbi:MAG: pimeloyl-ACP methyl ester carboxylesterase [Phenylobacterium sp.]|jgi:pimeloyl-ACP methyl ester carboxylesterase